MTAVMARPISGSAVGKPRETAAAVAHPAVGLSIAAVALKEGLEAWRGEGCCEPTA
jgi:hypothetical protein